MTTAVELSGDTLHFGSKPCFAGAAATELAALEIPAVVSLQQARSVCYDLASGSQLYLPSRVQSPGSLEPYNSAFCLVIMQLDSTQWMSNSCCGERSNQESTKQSTLCTSIEIIYHIYPCLMMGLGWQVIFRTKNQVEISRADTQCVKCFQVLKHVACLCKAVILCQSSSSQLYLPSRVQSPGSLEPYNSAFCPCHHAVGFNSMDVKFMLRRTQQPSSQQFVHQLKLFTTSTHV